MRLFDVLELRDCLLLIQIAVTVMIGVVPPWVALYLIYRQFKTHANALALNAFATRHQLFVMLTDNLTPDALSTMMLHSKDQFDAVVFEERYKDKPQRICSYLLMKRKYLYLLFSSLVERDFPVREKNIAEKWIRELGEFYEFHDVHGRHGRYYPEFSAYIATVLGATRPTQWMCDEAV